MRVFREHNASSAVLEAVGWALIILGLCFLVLLPRDNPVLLVTVEALCAGLGLAALLRARGTVRARVTFDDEGLTVDGPERHLTIPWNERLSLELETGIREVVYPGWWPVIECWRTLILHGTSGEIRVSARVVLGELDVAEVPRVRGELGVRLSAKDFAALARLLEQRLAEPQSTDQRPRL